MTLQHNKVCSHQGKKMYLLFETLYYYFRKLYESHFIIIANN